MAGIATMPAKKPDKRLTRNIKKPKSIVNGMKVRIKTLVKIEIREKNSKLMNKIGKTAA